MLFNFFLGGGGVSRIHRAEFHPKSNPFLQQCCRNNLDIWSIWGGGLEPVADPRGREASARAGGLRALL